LKRSAATEGAKRSSPGSRGTRPLPLNLDLLRGKGFLSAEEVELAEGLTLGDLRMEIPDLNFPFEGGGGVEHFRDTRCDVRTIEISIDESGLAARLDRATASLDRFAETRVQFLEDALHVGLALDGSDSTSFSFRVALLPPEPPRADEIHLSLYDYRWFGPLPQPARLLAYEWLTGILDHPLFAAPGRGRHYRVGVAGDIATFRPFKMLLLELFPKRGWKVPNLSEVALEDVHTRDGTLTLRAASREEVSADGRDRVAELRNSREGRRALAAYESKDLFARADECLYDGDIDRTLELLSELRRHYGLHPHLASRILDCLLADPSAESVDQARTVCEELLEDRPDDLRAHLARPLIAHISEGEREALEARERLSEILRDRGDRPDWVLSELAVADLLAADDPEAATERLEAAREDSPRNLSVLERLRSLYRRLGRRGRLADVLEELSELYSSREALRETYLELAELLLQHSDRAAEARGYIQHILEFDPDDLAALEALGESYISSGQPTRAVRALTAAARRAEDRGESERSRGLQFRAARIWRDELDDPAQALLIVRRARATGEHGVGEISSLDRPRAIERARQLEFAAELGEELGNPEEALEDWGEVVALLESLVRADDIPSRPVGEVESPAPSSPADRLARAHRRRADLLVELDRPDEAERLWKEALEIDPTKSDVAERLARYYRRTDRTDDLVDLLQQRLRSCDSPARSEQFHRFLAQIHDADGDPERADRHRSHADRFARQAEGTRGDDPWRRHEAETAPLNETLDQESSLEETPDDVPARGSPEEADGRAEDGTENFEAPDVETSPTTRKLSEGSAVTDREPVSEGGEENDIDATENGAGEAPTGEPLSEFRDEYRKLLDREGGTPESPPSARPSSADDLDDEQRSAPGATHRTDDGDEERSSEAGLELPAPESVSGPHGERGTDSEFSELAETTRPHRAPDPEQRLERARSTDDPEQIASVLEDLLASRDRGTAPVDWTDTEALERRRELAELHYYELEDTDAARPHLEQLRRDDPKGHGSAPEVLRALDAIYERNGETDRRISILENRLDCADGAEMAHNFRLLLARLHWRDRGDAETAVDLLDETLESVPDHEGAHRLLAEIRREQNDWESAARHLEHLLESAGSGLDALELEREYADLLQDRLDAPSEAIPHYESVLEDAPGDSRALEGLQSCREAVGAWRAYLEGLGHELGVLLGRTKPLTLEEMAALDPETLDDGSTLPTSEILAEAAECADERLDDLELAQRLYGAANRIWPEHVEALERRIEIDRQLGDPRQLADDLERYAESLLDPNRRAATLREAAQLHHERGESERAVELLERALRTVEETAETDRADVLRERLEALRRQTEGRGGP